jgi:hypothetical protein
LEHARQKYTLQLKATLVVRIRQNKENILYYAQEVLLEESIADRRVSCASKVVDNLQAHFEQV